MDIFDQATRSKIMRAVKSKDTKPELMVRSALHGLGFRFRLHDKTLPGKPDLVFKKYRAVVFVHGCYWHRHSDCKLASNPKQNKAFWDQKFTRNLRRDGEVYFQLKTQGWRTAVVWECSIRNKQDLPETVQSLATWLKTGGEYLEIPEAETRFYE